MTKTLILLDENKYDEAEAYATQQVLIDLGLSKLENYLREALLVGSLTQEHVRNFGKSMMSMITSTIKLWIRSLA